MNNTKKKVLFVIDTLQFGGAEQSLLANVSRFKNIDSIIFHTYEGDILKRRFEEKDIKVYSGNVKSKYGFVEGYKKLSAVIKNEKPDLIVAYLTRSELISRVAAKANKIPIVGTFVNDLYVKTYNQHLSWKSKKVVQVFKFLNKVSSKVCVGFVANSQEIKEANARHLSIPIGKIKVINRGRESSKFRKKDFGEEILSDSQIKFLNVSRLFPVKGHRFMIAGFKKFLEIHPNATLSIIGDGPVMGELLAMIKDQGLQDKVVLLGSRNNVPSILADYDCFVFPTLVEGFSGALVEAMFSGLPVLASDIPQNKEAITHMETGFLFKKEIPEEVTNAMIWFKNNRKLAEDFAVNAYNFAKQKFELNVIVEEFETYLHEIIANKN